LNSQKDCFYQAVELRLLYYFSIVSIGSSLQVGVSFLAGLGFAILLIPVNKWLAGKIGRLSQSLMAQKDARVKV